MLSFRSFYLPPAEIRTDCDGQGRRSRNGGQMPPVNPPKGVFSWSKGVFSYSKGTITAPKGVFSCSKGTVITWCRTLTRSAGGLRGPRPPFHAQKERIPEFLVTKMAPDMRSSGGFTGGGALRRSCWCRLGPLNRGTICTQLLAPRPHTAVGVG